MYLRKGQKIPGNFDIRNIRRQANPLTVTYCGSLRQKQSHNVNYRMKEHPMVDLNTRIMTPSRPKGEQKLRLPLLLFSQKYKTRKKNPPRTPCPKRNCHTTLSPQAANKASEVSPPSSERRARCSPSEAERLLASRTLAVRFVSRRRL